MLSGVITLRILNGVVLWLASASVLTKQESVLPKVCLLMCVFVNAKSVDLGISRWIRSFEKFGDGCARCQIRIWLWFSTSGSMVLAVSWTPPFLVLERSYECITLEELW